MKPGHRGQKTARRLRRAGERGQAMVEYSILNWLLVVALVLVTTVRIIPTGAGRQNVIEMFLASFRVYYDSIYLVLSSPF